jgi:signal transduction histidine kinase
LLEEIDTVGKNLASSHELQWSSEITPEPVVVLGDRPHLRRLLVILLDNACRYTEKGGSVRIRLTLEEQKAAIEVSDTGIGIPPVEVARIFDRFYRASNARFFDSEGTGLGLSIAHWIATAHSGTLSVESKVGAGTSMLLRLPTSRGS